MARVRVHRHGRRFGRRARGAVRARRDTFVLPQRGDLFGWSAWDPTSVAMSRSNYSGELSMGYGWITTAALNAAFSFYALLDSGTYRFDVIHFTGNNRGIYTVAVDGVTIGTFDGYSASDTHNVVSSITGVALSAGRHTVSFTMASKHASSSNYGASVASLTATRTGV